MHIILVEREREGGKGDIQGGERGRGGGKGGWQGGRIQNLRHDDEEGVTLGAMICVFLSRSDPAWCARTHTRTMASTRARQTMTPPLSIAVVQIGSSYVPSGNFGGTPLAAR